MSRQAVERIVDATLDATVRSCRRPATGAIAETYLIELEGGGGTASRVRMDDADFPERAVCKLGGVNVWTGDVIEPAVLEVVGRETELPVPNVLATGRLEGGADELPDRWALYEHCVGTNPGPSYPNLESEVRRRLVADAGSLLGRLHAATPAEFDRVGGLARCDGRFQGGRDWRRRLRVCEPVGWHALDPGPLLEMLPVTFTGDDGCRPVLTHGDYQPGNLLVDRSGAVTTVLDWGNAHVTHAEYALARAEIRFIDVYARRLSSAHRWELRRAFRAGYARHAMLKSGFEERKRTYTALWLLQSAANYATIASDERGRRQLRRQCRNALER
ncbi:phosphotransferase family protein [Natrarchaeobius sp. A-rgal3]|uniref:phosphotransferase family protein n=1 Tax=Natrarchaeobius versutus TaxID=1679078 RepID=UPI00350F7C20